MAGPGPSQHGKGSLLIPTSNGECEGWPKAPGSPQGKPHSPLWSASRGGHGWGGNPCWQR
eukprot:9634007-Heterocapsa_arctica.AAC.1